VLPKPELLIYLYSSIDRLQTNIRKRGRSYEQKIPSEYLQKIQDGYLEYIRKQQDMRIVIIDTNKIDFVENPSDYPKLKEIILAEYPVGVHRITPES
jgi:deoxyadenosine/deoxycytidine kinase